MRPGPAFPSYRAFYEETYIRFARRIEALPAATLVASEQAAGDGSVGATPDLVLGRIAHGRGRYSADLGAGRFDGRLDANETLLLAPHTHSSIQCTARHGVELVALPYAALTKTFGGEINLPSDGDFGALHASALTHPFFSRTVATLFSIGDYTDSAARMFLDGALASLVAMLALESGRSPPTARPRRGLAGWQLARVREKLAEIATPTPLAELARLVNLSQYHFCRAFKEATGLPPHQYQVVLRMERAKELLATTRLSILEVSTAVGYADQSHFGAVFRRHVGATPSRFRRERRG